MGIFRRSNNLSHTPAPLEHVAVGTKVQIIGEPGNYVVVRVDPKRYTADLMLVGQLSKMEFGVHFRSLRPASEAGGVASAVSDLTTTE